MIPIFLLNSKYPELLEQLFDQANLQEKSLPFIKIPFFFILLQMVNF